jgi:hypothetical protein
MFLRRHLHKTASHDLPKVADRPRGRGQGVRCGSDNANRPFEEIGPRSIESALFRARHGMRANEPSSQDRFQPPDDPRFDASHIRNGRTAGKRWHNFFGQRLHGANGCAEHAQVGSAGGPGLVTRNAGKEPERSFHGLLRASPKTQIPLRPQFLQSQRQRTANQPRAEDGDRAQGTRKILFV